MPQQINLYHAGLQRRRTWGPGHTGATLAAVLALVVLAGAGLRWSAHRTQGELALVEQELSGRRAHLLQVTQGGLPADQPPSAEPSASDAAPAGLAELQHQVQRLRALDAGQQRVRDLLVSGAAGRRSGYAEHLLALARQAQARVWLTGLSVDPATDQIEIKGRLADPAALPDYLRQLSTEPQFQGRRFAHLQLRRLDSAPEGDASADGPAGISEFTLSSQDPSGARAPTATHPAPPRR